MQHKTWLVRSLPIVAGLALAGCGAPPADEAVGIESALTAANGISLNGISLNGISLNGVSFNGVSLNGVSLNGVSLNGLVQNGVSLNGISLNGVSLNGVGNLTDPNVESFMSYLVGCALRDGDSVTYTDKGQSFTFAGDLGMAPEWKDHACGGSCQRWISACLLARTNAKGEHVRISMRGDNDGLALDPGELLQYRSFEGAYYGNLFTREQPIFACYPANQPQLLRVCGPSLSDCPMRVVGPCPQACRGQSRHDGVRDCATSLPARRGADLWEEVVTVYLHTP
jgi:hypothetical protein